MNNTTKIHQKSSIYSKNPYNPTGLSENSTNKQNKSAIGRIAGNSGNLCQNDANFAAQISLKPEKCRLKNPCKGCGGSQGIITPVDRATGNPHSYRLDCRDCGRFQRWVGQREFDQKMGGHNA